MKRPVIDHRPAGMPPPVSRKISTHRLLRETKVVPSGVAEVANLQASEKFVYLRP